MDKILKTILDIKSQKEITDRKFVTDLGISPTSVSEWKAGKSKTYLKYLPMIADYLEIPTDFLYGKMKEINSIKYTIEKIDRDNNKEILFSPQHVYAYDEVKSEKPTDSETTFDKEELNLLRMFRKFNKIGKKKIMAYINDIYSNKMLKDE